MAGSLADQLRKAGLAATEPEDPPAAEAPEPTEEELAYGPKVVVRFERKGHGGKTVTRIDGVISGHRVLVDQLKRQLGTGGRVDGDAIVLHGRQVERVARWLESQGVKRVVRG